MALAGQHSKRIAECQCEVRPSTIHYSPPVTTLLQLFHVLPYIYNQALNAF